MSGLWSPLEALLRKAYEVMAYSIAGFTLIEEVEAGGEVLSLPFEVRAGGCCVELSFSVREPSDGLRGVVKVKASGSGLLLYNGEPLWGVDPAHTYFPLPNGGKVTLLLTPTSHSGVDYGGVLRVEYLAVAEMDWSLFLAGLKLAYLYDYLKGFGRESYASLAERLLEKLARVRVDAQPHQLAALGLLLLDSRWEVEGVPRPRKDLPGYRMEASYLAFKMGPSGVARAFKSGSPYNRAEASRMLGDLEAIMSEVLEGPRAEGILYLVGHSHIDVAWLWSLREGRVKAAATIATAASLSEEFPWASLALHTPYFLDILEESFPELLGKVKRLVGEGKWSLVGGVYVEGDLQVVDGESLARQLLYGQRTFRKHIGRRALIGWLPDNFGYPASLPQLLAKAGIKALVIHKVMWGESGFPLHAFRWRGIDGSEIPVLVIHDLRYNYNAPMKPSHLREYWESFKHRGEVPHVYPYGYGDGGGGPTIEMSVAAGLVAKLPLMPRIVYGGLDRLAEELASQSHRLPLYEGELYLELHRGVFTTNVRVKDLVSRAEEALRASEIAASISEALLGSKASRESLEGLWKRVLIAEFHDIISGTAIEDVYLEVVPTLENVIGEAEGIVESSIGRSGEGVAVFNALPWRRVSLVTLRGRALKEVPCQKVGKHLLVLVEAPGLGVKGYRLGSECTATWDGGKGLVYVEDGGGEITLGNGALEAVIDSEGRLASFRVEGREFLREPSAAFRVHSDEPAMWDAWDIDRIALSVWDDMKVSERPRLSLRGPLRSCVEYALSLRGSRARVSVCLDAYSPTLDYRVKLRIAGRKVLVKAWFYPRLSRDWKGLFEVPFGYIERDREELLGPKFEAPALRWAAAYDGRSSFLIASPMLHGYSFTEGSLGLSLLKRPLFPNPKTDEGLVEARFHVAARTGSPVEDSWAFRVALEKWSPLRAVYGGPSGGELSILKVSPEGRIMVSAFKPGEDGGWVARLYNPLTEPVEAVLEPSFKYRRIVETTIDETGKLGDVGERFKIGGFEVKTLLFVT
ncbi:MAG: hypothetical protein F7B17_04825 [Desulfurococcales archaeon]|nr:hypothetical protein [Desulfurococcales archaeon]